jgi:hypothetical protein
MRASLHCLALTSIVVAAAVAGLEAAAIRVKTPPHTSQAAPEVRDPRLAEEALDQPIRAAVDRVLAGKGFAASADAAEPDFHVDTAGRKMFAKFPPRP